MIHDSFEIVTFYFLLIPIYLEIFALCFVINCWTNILTVKLYHFAFNVSLILHSNQPRIFVLYAISYSSRNQSFNGGSVVQMSHKHDWGSKFRLFRTWSFLRFVFIMLQYIDWMYIEHRNPCLELLGNSRNRQLLSFSKVKRPLSQVTLLPWRHQFTPCLIAYRLLSTLVKCWLSRRLSCNLHSNRNHFTKTSLTPTNTTVISNKVGH